MKSKSSSTSRKKRSRRPKFLSLRRQITATATAEEMTSPPDEGNVADRFFKGEEGCATTLTGLLQPEEEEEAAPEESPMSSLSAAYSVDAGTEFQIRGGHGSVRSCVDRKSLVRQAMRSREREDDEEEVRWVRMSEVVSEEVSSRAAEEEEEGEGEETRRREGCGRGGGSGGRLALKLDYKEVEEAWDGCGKGRPFFSWPDSGSTMEGPQIVPDLRIQHDDFFYHHDLNAANGVLWGVPDHKSCIQHGPEENGDQSIEGWRLGQREASVLRYREKRMNRLFSKRIRYQVRKLNAEKRPRVKGRFVKRS